MAIEIQKVSDVLKTQGIKCLVYGSSGVGKTSLLNTLSDVLLISFENGELAVKGHKTLDVVKPKSLAELRQVFEMIQSGKWKNVAIDSLTELGEMIVAELKRDPEYSSMKDGMKLWMRFSDLMLAVSKSFRDIDGVNVILIALPETKLENYVEKLVPLIPAQKVQAKLPALYDEVLYLNVDQSGVRELVCQPTSSITAKDRSGTLDPVEPADLNAIFAKINKKQ